ncbi:MAG: putative type II secretion system protein F [Chlamydiales bacterium]|nr:putative type II secretion system protein F [Chlamydiales bacterium]MCH9636287.1 putative type II secretion system protein F [Chlamydiales bacterium]
MKVSYRYLNREGQKRSGVIEASSLQEAKERLMLDGIYVISMRQKRTLRTKSTDLSSEQLALFTSALGHLLEAKIPLFESLLSLKEQYSAASFFPTISMLCDEIREGSSLADAMAKAPKSFDQLYVSMVAAGESCGRLDETLQKLSHLLQKRSRLKKQLLTASLYPLILLSFSFLLIVVLLTYVVPSLEVLFADMEVNRFTRIVFFGSHIVTRGWPIYLPLMGATVAAALYYWRKKRDYFDRAVLHIPVVKRVIIQTALARFCRTMGSLLEGGVSIISALQIARGVMKQPLLESSIERAEQRIIEGSSLSVELAKASWVPQMVPRMLQVGEEGGNLSGMLGKVADLYEEEMEKLLGRICVLAQPVILLFLGAVVGLIMLAILLPLTDVSGFMGGF